MIQPVQSIKTIPETPTVLSDRAIEAAAPIGDRSKSVAHDKADDAKSQSILDADQAAHPLTVEPDFRLVIEHNIERSVLVYKLVNRVTGEVVSEISRDDVVKFISDPSARAGSLIDTTA